ncbi:MAG TPA: DegV family protein [Clostridiales bacterium]|nr:DegV family protein [Clostridiales bacterium]
MEKIALITDSACDIDDETLRRYSVHVLPFKILYKDREYTDGVDITPQEVYINMKTEIPKSSQPSMEDIEKLYQKLERENYTHAISINISSGISGTVNGMEAISKQFPGIKTFLYDTKSTSVCQGIILKKCGELIERGAGFEEIVKAIPEMKKKIHMYFVFGTLEYAIKGGRIGKISGTIGDVLNIKPIVCFDEEYGQCFTCEKVRGRVKSVNRLIELGEKFTAKNKCDAYVIHGNVEEDALKVCERLRMNPGIKNVHLIGQISAIVGVYCGPGTLGVCYSEI